MIKISPHFKKSVLIILSTVASICLKNIKCEIPKNRETQTKNFRLHLLSCLVTKYKKTKVHLLAYPIGQWFFLAS